MSIERARNRIAALRCRTDTIDPGELDAIWADLETAHIDDIIGEWRGVALDTGHRAVAAMRAIRWYGTRFNSRMDAHPIVRYDPDGNLYSDTDYADGAASLWMVEFRGEVTATMVYDGVPVFDHLKRVDDNTLLGIMNGKQFAPDSDDHFYFLLDRVPATEEKMAAEFE
ncbi:DUF4334 domain-containing protein [Kutzneria sp. CA-103260]|uniref:DUF4334 domain-containing protein n=1 Tax=Kutzneria sp. CA-103260 TaxID=2802641 RepID=UPI001BA91A6E|nr:DUF4334 domain-containing protein [Kutzneria sp. CA-103260]QUQ65538.1 hypothetical protein JJ691_32620 [Kutzneria sp. CA-103260]